MMKRTSLWWLVAILLLVGGLLVWFAYNGGTYTIVVTQEEAQAKLDEQLARFAAQTPKPKHLEHVVFESARVQFVDGTVVLDATISDTLVRLGNRMIRADVHATGGVEYRDGALYVRPTSMPQFTNVFMTKEGAQASSFAHTKQLVKEKIREFAEKHGWEEIGQTFIADFKAWRDEHALKALSTLLDHHPVYTLKDTSTQLVVRAVLDKVEVVGDTLHVTLSVVQFGYLLFWAFGFVVAAVVLWGILIAYPELGLPFMLLG